MRWEALAIAALTLTAGCLGSFGTADGGGDADPPAGGASMEAVETQRIERTLSFSADVDGPRVVDGRVGPSWEALLGPGLVEMELSLSWNESANGFGLDVERPDGSTYEVAPPGEPGAGSVEDEVPDASSGAYAFHVTSGGNVVVEDEVRLEVHVVLEVPLDGTRTADGDLDRGAVAVEETEDGYRATVEYRANGTVDDAVDATVDTVNGAVDAATHDGDGRDASEATVRVTVWANAGTREQARERALEIHVRLSVEQDAVEAVAEADDWDDRGASVEVVVPDDVRLAGELDTTNGPVHLRGLTVGDLVADTTNGGIDGTVTGEGELAFDTTNGVVDVAFAPTGDSELLADTTNGNVELALAESGEIGYEIDADTTNGRVTEGMSEASLHGSEDEATLRTDGYADRSIQVTGLADTTNGNVHFAGR